MTDEPGVTKNPALEALLDDAFGKSSAVALSVTSFDAHIVGLILHLFMSMWCASQGVVAPRGEPTPEEMSSTDLAHLLGHYGGDEIEMLKHVTGLSADFVRFANEAIR